MVFHASVTYTGSNGRATFTRIDPGKYRVRVVALAPGHIQTAVRRRVVIPEGPSYCTANLIDDGVVIDGSNVTVYFQGVGPVKQFLCIVDRQRKFSCENVNFLLFHSESGMLMQVRQIKWSDAFMYIQLLYL